jgi:hypothetical protein
MLDKDGVPPGFGYCNGGRNDQPLRLSYLSDLLWSDGRDITGRRSYNGVTGWNRSPVQREWG